MSLLFRVFGLLALAAFAGCVGTPQPDPPNLSPERVRSMGGVRGGSIVLVGERGAVSAGAPAEVLVANLDAPAVAVRVAAVAPDGSFSIEVPVSARDELRLWVRDEDGERSAPVDVITDGDELLPATRTLTCLRVEPDVVVLRAPGGGGASARVVLASTCPEVVAVETVALRAAIAGVTVESAPVSVPPGARAELELRLEPDETAPGSVVDDVLLVTVSGDTERDRRAVVVGAEHR